MSKNDLPLKNHWKSKTDKSILPEFNDLVVTRINSPYIHENGQFIYQNLIVEEGAVLIFENYDKWIKILIRNDARIDGKIILRNWKNGLGTVPEVAPDGQELTHTYKEDKVGGKGGSKRYPGARRGTYYDGNGAEGTPDYGGGGGSGHGLSNNLPRNGSGPNGGQASHNDTRYARAGNGGDGGNGKSPAGGLLYLKINGTLSSNSGQIIATGSNGKNGNAGGNSRCINWRRAVIDCSHPGNGGGGAPGGDGGAIYIYCTSVSSLPDIDVSGGRGGSGGPGGITLNHRSSEIRFQGNTGEDGQNGNNGKVIQLPCKLSSNYLRWPNYRFLFHKVH